MTRAELVAHARDAIARGSKSFAMASGLFAPAMREQVWLLYAWCRRCDDITDGQDHGGAMQPVRDALARVEAVQALTDRAYAGETIGDPAFDALGLVAKECALPKALIDDVIAGFRLDATGWQPQSEDDLYRYSYHVAGAVGGLMAIIMGVSPDDDATLDRACDLGLAFQLANIARDVAEDAAAGRCYLPHDHLRAAGIDPDEVLDPAVRPALVAEIEWLGAASLRYAASARTGANALPFRARWAVLAAANIYGGIARQVLASQGGSLKARVFTSKAQKLRGVAGALLAASRRQRFVARDGLWQRPHMGG